MCPIQIIQVDRPSSGDDRQSAEARFANATRLFWAETEFPTAWGVGIATVREVDADADPVILDVRFIKINMGDKINGGSLAAIFQGMGSLYESGVYPLIPSVIKDALKNLHPYTDDPREDHPNIDALEELLETEYAAEPLLKEYSLWPVLFCLDSLDSPPQDAVDAYFRLHLLSGRFVQPHGVNLDGIFGLLSNNAWTNYGPVLQDDVPKLERVVRRRGGQPVTVTSVDKFPRMTDYVIPSGVRIADADRVRLGAYLEKGTTVMHEGFVNFNAGTLGASMVEGRISAGVVIGDGTDIGGGASIMGTLSGGGKEVIRIGEGCLLGANSGLGISLGNNCVVEAGLYLTAGTIVAHLPDGPGGERIEVKARELSDYNNLLFLRHSVTGAIEAWPRAAKAVELNQALHAN